MSSHSDPDRERRAREEAWEQRWEDQVGRIAHACAVRFSRESHKTLAEHVADAIRQAVNTYAVHVDFESAAIESRVLAAERDRMARVVEQLDGYSHQFDPDNICMQPEDDGPYLLRDDVRTALAAPPETPNV